MPTNSQLKLPAVYRSATFDASVRLHCVPSQSVLCLATPATQSGAINRVPTPKPITGTHIILCFTISQHLVQRYSTTHVFVLRKVKTVRESIPYTKQAAG